MLALLTLLHGAVAGGGLFSLLIYVIVIGVVFALLYWLVSVAPLPAPFKMVARFGLAIVAVLFLVYLLLGLVGSPSLPQLR